MKIVLAIFISLNCFICSLCFANFNEFNSFNYQQHTNDIYNLIQEIEVRTFRNPKEYCVSKNTLLKLAKEQLCDRYIIKIIDGKKELITTKNYIERKHYLDLYICLEPTKDYIKSDIPKSYNIEIVKELVDNEYMATNLVTLDLIFICTPLEIKFNTGEIITNCKLIRTEYTNFSSPMINYNSPVFLYVIEDQNNCWRESTPEDILEFYNNGYNFLVKTLTYKTYCIVCNGTGINNKKYNNILNELKRRSNYQTKRKIDLLNKNKPICEKCKGEKYLLLNEFRMLNKKSEYNQ